MKNLIVVLILFVSTLSFSQGRDAVEFEKIFLTGHTFKSSFNVFSDIERDNYSLQYFEKNTDQFAWGNFISFQDKTFSTNYSAPCGNDCFTSVAGTYKYISANRIQVYVESINRSGFCQAKNEEPKKVIGIFQITETETGLALTKE